MKREEVEKLLGGYATGTLTESERKALFEAALTDQTLFNALANEQALKDLLDNPRARRRLLTALRAQASRPSLPSRLREWFRPLVAVRAVAGGAAVAILAVVTVTRLLDVVPPATDVTEESRRAEPAPGRLQPAEKSTAKKKDLAPKKAELRDQITALDKAASREADAKQNAGQGTNKTAGEPTPESKAPAQQPEVAPAPAAPSGKLFARAETSREREAGSARVLFYDAIEKQKALSADRPAEEEQPSEARQSTTAESAEQAPQTPAASGLSLAKKESTGQTLTRLGIRYTLRQSEPLGLVEPGPALLAVEVNQDVYLYVHARDASGAIHQLLPLQAGDPARVQRGTRYYIPLTGPPHGLRVVITLTRSPRSEATGGFRIPPAGGELLREEANETRPDGVPEKWVYLVETAPSTTSGFSAEIIAPVR